MVKKIVFVLALLLSFIISITPVIKSGLNYTFGIGFWGPNGHDAIWHLSLINNISNPLKINLPIMSGEYLQNYHPLYNILISFLVKLTHIPSLFWHFQLFPVIGSIIFIYSSYKIGFKLIGKKYGGILLVLFNVSLNSFGWIVELIRHGNLRGESLFWSMQSPSNLINPPFFLSLIFINIILLLILYQPKYHHFFIFLFLCLLPLTKVYSAPLGFLIYFSYCVYLYRQNKKSTPFLIFFITFITSVFLFLIFNPHSSALLTLEPFWFLRSMVDSRDKLYIPILSSFINNTPIHLFNFRLWIIYLFLFIVFIVGNYGFRTLGFLYVTSLKNYLEKTLFYSSLIYLSLPVFFIQKGTSWNTIQFIYYSMFIQNIFLLKYLTKLPNKKYKIIVTLILTISFLVYYSNSPNYLDKVPPASLPISESNALDFLKKQPIGNVLTVPYDPFWKNKFTTTPIPLYAYETSGYVAAFSQHPTFLEDEINLQNSGYKYEERRKQALKFFQQKNIFEDRGFLINNQISYIYIADKNIQNISLNYHDIYLEPIYDQNQILIYRVLR